LPYFDEVPFMNVLDESQQVQHTDDTETPTGRSGVTLAQAAAALGITPEGVRQRIRRGKLSAYKIGRDWYVNLNKPATVLRSVAQPDTTQEAEQTDRLPVSGGEPTAATELIGQLGAEVAFLRDEILFLRDELRRRDGHQQPSVPLPPDWMPAPMTAVPSPLRQPQPQERGVRRWWWPFGVLL
jgi:hypothetical protein